MDNLKWQLDIEMKNGHIARTSFGPDTWLVRSSKELKILTSLGEFTCDYAMTDAIINDPGHELYGGTERTRDIIKKMDHHLDIFKSIIRLISLFGSVYFMVRIILSLLK